MDICAQTKSLSTIKILQESIKLLTKKALILLIFLLSILSFFLIYYFNHLSISPLMTELVINIGGLLFYENDKKLYESIIKDVREIIIVQTIFKIITFLVSSVFTIATIHVLSSTYSLYDTRLTPKDVLSKLVQTFKGPFITNLYIGIFQLGYTCLALASLIVLILFYSPHTKVIFTVASTIQALVLLILLSYLAIVWYVSVVISVVQEGCYGLVAIGKAAKLIRGRRMQGTLIVFIEQLLIVILLGAYMRMMMVYVQRSPAALLALGFIYIGLCLVINMIIWATSTIFYYECMKMHGKTIEVAMDGNGRQVYSSLSDVDCHGVASSKLLTGDKCQGMV